MYNVKGSPNRENLNYLSLNENDVTNIGTCKKLSMSQIPMPRFSFLKCEILEIPETDVLFFT